MNTNYWKIGIFDPKGINPNPLNNQSYSNEYKVLAKFWSELPAYKISKQIVKLILNNDIILIKSATGSGKSVLVPKLVLHANNYSGQIIMTLPKKIITKKAAEFSAKTLDVKLGEQIGYMFRGENIKSSKTILLYSTDGSLISMLRSDPLLKSIDTIIIDEVHERKVNIDLLLYLLKNSIKQRKEKNMKPLKLIIMSATINEDIFISYYKDFKFEWLELAGIPNYPIKSIYLEFSLDLKTNKYIEKGKDIINQIIININSSNPDYPEGDILFFVCTISECDKLAAELSYEDCFIMGLYSGFNSELEQYISNPTKFKELDPKYKRRVFISTNVAESSLTIDGIVYVIDSGLELNVKFDPVANINIMNKNFISQAQMTQRKGRAGRTKQGVCFHLYTPHEEFNAIKYPEPEIKCIDLKNTCLSLMKICSDTNTKNNLCSIEETINMFLNFIEPPDKQFIINGFDFALKNKLIDHTNKLTKLGLLILETRLDLMDGLCLIWAFNVNKLVFKNVFKIIVICSCLKTGIDDLFNNDIDINVKSDLINELSKKSSSSEHLLLFNLFDYIFYNKNLGLFNLKLFDMIMNIYSKQIKKLKYIFKKFNVKLDVIVNKANDMNIMNSFSFGYKYNRAYRYSNKFKYNKFIVDLGKRENTIKIDSSVDSIIFYSNLYWRKKLNIMIYTPYLLE